jgi:hypothetical protein
MGRIQTLRGPIFVAPGNTAVKEINDFAATPNSRPRPRYDPDTA